MKRQSKLIALLSASLLLTSTVLAQRGPLRGRTPVKTKVSSTSGKTALLVFLENGGVATNFAACRVGGRKVRIRIPVATCGNLTLALKPGESVVQMVRRAAGVIRRNRACVSPTRWRVKSVSFDQWFKLASDYLLEELTKSIAQLQNTRSKYSKVEVMEDAALTPRNALAKMRQLVRSGYTLDIHVLTHGGEESFYGGNGARFDNSSFFAPAKRIRGLKIRSVYQMNCVSGTLMDDWTKLGAKVVNGTYGTKNNSMPQSYFHFTSKWLGGATFNAAVQGAYNEARIYTEPVYRLVGVGHYVADSRHRVEGNGNCRLTAPPMKNPVAATANRIIKKTTAALCAGYKTAKKTAQQACALMIGAKCKISEVALELQRQYRCSPANIAKFLRRANCTVTQITNCLVTTLKCSAQNVAKYLVAAGCSPTDVAKRLSGTLKCSQRLCAKYLRRAGCSTRVVARALEDGLNCTSRNIAKHLRYAGCTTKNIAIALKKDIKCSSRNIAKYLRGAGCSVNQVASALKNGLKCSTTNVARHLKSAGCSFNQVAKGIWAYSSKSARSLKSLADSMMAAFKMNAFQVGTNLAKIGIR